VPMWEAAWLRRDKSRLDVSVTISPVRDAGGHVVRLASILRDVSERKRMQAQLVQAERLASVGTLAAGVAHEINNPLAYVIANLAFVAEELRGLHGETGDHRLPDLVQALDEALSGAGRVKQIVRDLKLFARADEEQLGPVDIHKVIESSLSIVRGEIRHRARLSRAYGENVPPVVANESRLGQVLINLLVNAAQAIEEGKVEQNEIRIATSRGSGGRAVIEVRDTGCGIPVEQLPRIFDPFFTTKAVGVGTGLGLAICHGIVSSLGGEIMVDSTVGRGTTFRVVLPPAPRSALEPAVQTVAESQGPAPATHAPRKRVLVVDDESALLQTLERSLGQEFELVLKSSGREALTLLERDRSFDHIVCDLMMPEVTGMDLFEQLREIQGELARRVIFMTGGAFTPRARDFLVRIDNRFLEKPFDMEQLRQLLHGPPAR